jgi:hypothetical protein
MPLRLPIGTWAPQANRALAAAAAAALVPGSVQQQQQSKRPKHPN